ncbi:MAG: DUF6677 family protein [Tepidisphaeraceae bacterium]
MTEPHTPLTTSPTIVAVAGWLIPGAGYWLLGQRGRATTIGVTIVLLFVCGLIIGGIRVVDVPGYDRAGMQNRLDSGGRRIDRDRQPATYDQGAWALTSRGFFVEVANKPWFLPQVLSGPVTMIAATASLGAARAGVPASHARPNEIGTLYTAIAGMLNLLAIIDSAHRAARGPS